jgi:hypothetical protein
MFSKLLEEFVEGSKKTWNKIRRRPNTYFKLKVEDAIKEIIPIIDKINNNGT